MGFAVALVFFGRSMHHMIERHGDGGASWLEPAGWTLVAISILLTFRRIWRNVTNIIVLKDELTRYKRDVDQLKAKHLD
jgi:hypothetical protein